VKESEPITAERVPTVANRNKPEQTLDEVTR
jgi:hypothetical protein